MPQVKNLVIRQGGTFTQVVRWEAPPFVYKVISGITKAAPAVITASGHAVPDGWRVAVVSVLGMTEINALSSPPRSREFFQATYVDPNTVSLNKVNASGYSTYVSGGYLQYYTPVDLGGYAARMKIKDKVGGTTLDEYTSAAGEIVLDNAAKTITISIAAAVTEIYTWKKGVYDLEMVGPISLVVPLLVGTVKVEREITTT